MTEFGQFLLAALVCGVIGFLIQYYIIKGAVISALKEQSKTFNKDSETIKLLHIIAEGTNAENYNSLVTDLKMKAYLKQKKFLEEAYSGKTREKRLAELNEEYKDIL